MLEKRGEKSTRLWKYRKKRFSTVKLDNKGKVAHGQKLISKRKSSFSSFQDYLTFKVVLEENYETYQTQLGVKIQNFNTQQSWSDKEGCNHGGGWPYGNLFMLYQKRSIPPSKKEQGSVHTFRKIRKGSRLCELVFVLESESGLTSTCPLH